MCEYVGLILKIFYEDTFLKIFVCDLLRTIVFDILGTAPNLIRGVGEMIININRNRFNGFE